MTNPTSLAMTGTVLYVGTLGLVTCFDMAAPDVFTIFQWDMVLGTAYTTIKAIYPASTTEAIVVMANTPAILSIKGD